MILISNVDVYGWETAIRGMRNPMNSWNQSDSVVCPGVNFRDCHQKGPCPRVDDDFTKDVFCIGGQDYTLMQNLVKAGPDHAKFLRFIDVTLDINAPLYWWKEFDTYKVGTVTNSCSTMHKIHSKEFELNDFSHEHLFNGIDRCDGNSDVEYYENSTTCLEYVICVLNLYRTKFIQTKDKRFWWQLIQLLPSSYNQRRTVKLNYAVLRNMYHARKNHKLDEWRLFCVWIESLPYSELITV